MILKDTFAAKPNPEIIPSEDERPLWEIIAELSAELSHADWANQPTDGAINYRHYLYGQPKRDDYGSAAAYIPKDEAA